MAGRVVEQAPDDLGFLARQLEQRAVDGAPADAAILMAEGIFDFQLSVAHQLRVVMFKAVVMGFVDVNHAETLPNHGIAVIAEQETDLPVDVGDLAAGAGDGDGGGAVVEQGAPELGRSHLLGDVGEDDDGTLAAARLRRGVDRNPAQLVDFIVDGLQAEGEAVDPFLACPGCFAQGIGRGNGDAVLVGEAGSQAGRIQIGQAGFAVGQDFGCAGVAAGDVALGIDDHDTDRQCFEHRAQRLFLVFQAPEKGGDPERGEDEQDAAEGAADKARVDGGFDRRENGGGCQANDQIEAEMGKFAPAVEPMRTIDLP